MKHLSTIATNMFTAIVLGGVVVFGAYGVIPGNMQAITTGWLSWGAGAIIGIILITGAVYLGVKTPTDGFAGSRLLKSYKTTITD